MIPAAPASDVAKTQLGREKVALFSGPHITSRRRRVQAFGSLQRSEFIHVCLAE